MRAVVDTNVLISGLFWGGAPHRLLEHARTGLFILISSPGLMAELEDVLRRSKFAARFTRAGTTPDQVLAHLRQLVELVDPPPLATPICRDPDDDAVLALAQAARAGLIVSGDADLLSLHSFAGIPIVPPDLAVARIEVSA